MWGMVEKGLARSVLVLSLDTDKIRFDADGVDPH